MQPSGPTLQVLLVEDDAILQQMLAHWLRTLGYCVSLARNLAGARASLADDPYDLILLDLSLVDGNGLDLLKHTSALLTPPLVIVVTGDGSALTVIEALRHGAFDYLTKPINVDLLRRTVERASEHITYRRDAAELARLRAQELAVQATARAAVHHLSQDLTVIMGEAQLLEEELSDPAVAASLGRIVKAVTSATAKLAALRQARRFVTADHIEGDSMLDLDAAAREAEG